MSYKPKAMRLVGENIRLLRIQRGMSQAELADALNVSQSMISAIEKGDRADIMTSTVRRIAKALGCTDGEITQNAEFPPSAAEIAAQKEGKS